MATRIAGRRHRHQPRGEAGGAAVHVALDGVEPDWDTLREPTLRRRAGYLLDLVRTMRGQSALEAARLAAVREALGRLESETFWPGERSLPAGIDPLAERWGFTRGCDTVRLKTALRRPARALPEADDPGPTGDGTPSRLAT